MTDISSVAKKPRWMPLLGRFLGSMNMAIMLLVTIAIASVAGTILRQNEPYQNYLVKFGPYWHELYKALGLYDVYSSGWFILILAFLVISTSVCVTRHTPAMVKSLRRFREDIQERALQNLKDHSAWYCAHAVQSLRPQLVRYLQKTGYRTRVSESEDRITIAAMRGSSNRFGYFLTHIAIVIICIGGLIDGNIPFKLRILSGDLKIETRDSNISAIPSESRLPADNPSFRSGVSIPEGARVNYAFINTGGGFLLQELPFAILVRDFRIEHYANGQPKSFESDLVIQDPVSGRTEEHTIAVNHPLYYRGYTLYQSSFGDGGTTLRLNIRPLQGDNLAQAELEGTVGRASVFPGPDGNLNIEFDDFRKFNIFPATEPDRPKDFVDHGPSITFKIRQADGTAREYINYQYPVALEGRYFFLSGVRSGVNEEFQYLYIPVDGDFSMERFFRLLSYLHNDAKLETITRDVAENSLDQLNQNDPVLRDNVQQAMLALLQLFRSGGIDAIPDYAARQVPAEKQADAIQAYLKLLQGALHEVYLDVLGEEGLAVHELDAESALYLEEATTALNAIPYYGAPFYLELKTFDEKLATGLQITRTPGRNIVYLGFAMLITGVFLLFYVAHQRIWIMLSSHEQGTKVLMAGTRTRHQRLFSREFRALAEKLRQACGG